MDNQQNVEIDAVKAKIIELEAKAANYFHQYEAAPGIFLFCCLV